MEFECVNLEEANAIEIIQSYNQGNSLITKINFQELKKIINQSVDILKSFVTLGKHYRNLKLKREQEFELMKQAGDFEFWPFKTKAQYELQIFSTYT
jgi:hypothetical protein